jgi:hypothetical protein
MLLLQPFIVWSAISMGIYSSIFVPLITTTMKNSFDKYPDLRNDLNKQNQMALFAMIPLGVGEIIGG